jgi:hypothetical protein
VSNVNVRARAQEAHRKAVTVSASEIAKFLQDALGQKLTAHIARVADPKTVGAWASGDQAPRDTSEQRLRAAFQVFHLLQEQDSSYVVRAWFIGMNPQLENEAPAEALREGRFRDVFLAAEAYLSGG